MDTSQLSVKFPPAFRSCPVDKSLTDRLGTYRTLIRVSSHSQCFELSIPLVSILTFPIPWDFTRSWLPNTHVTLDYSIFSKSSRNGDICLLHPESMSHMLLSLLCEVAGMSALRGPIVSVSSTLEWNDAAANE